MIKPTLSGVGRGYDLNTSLRKSSTICAYNSLATSFASALTSLALTELQELMPATLQKSEYERSYFEEDNKLHKITTSI